jgi:hypothetical protein
VKASLLLDALDLPACARVAKRVPKTMLHENGAPTAADKRQINEGIEQLVWVAALKPTTIGVAEYRDELREVLEIAVLQLTLRIDAKVGRLIELVHRAVPYPVLLIAEQGSNSSLSLAQKRWSQAEAGKTVLEGDVITVMVINIDRKNRGINLSIKAKEMADEASAMQQVTREQPSNAGLTNLGALLKAKLDNKSE